MRFRRLQELNEQEQWEDHGYVYELEDGRCTFRYNPLVWESTGSRLSGKLYESGTKLEDVQQIILSGDQLRWLDIEEIDGAPEDIKAALDKACKMPWLRPISMPKPIIA
jgi:hypothetical protein